MTGILQKKACAAWQGKGVMNECLRPSLEMEEGEQVREYLQENDAYHPQLAELNKQGERHINSVVMLEKLLKCAKSAKTSFFVRV